jgi:hypothetical protein
VELACTQAHPPNNGAQGIHWQQTGNLTHDCNADPCALRNHSAIPKPETEEVAATPEHNCCHIAHFRMQCTSQSQPRLLAAPLTPWYRQRQACIILSAKPLQEHLNICAAAVRCVMVHNNKVVGSVCSAYLYNVRSHWQSTKRAATKAWFTGTWRSASVLLRMKQREHSTSSSSSHSTIASSLQYGIANIMSQCLCWL